MSAPCHLASHRPHPRGLTRSPSWVTSVRAKGHSVLGGSKCVLSTRVPSPLHGGQEYRALHLHACIQGQFPHKSIAQSEYTIFMSQCVLELKYIEGNKNNRLGRSGSLGSNITSCSLAVRGKYIRGCNCYSPTFTKNQKQNLSTRNHLQFEFGLLLKEVPGVFLIVS